MLFLLQSFLSMLSFFLALTSLLRQEAAFIFVTDGKPTHMDGNKQ